MVEILPDNNCLPSMIFYYRESLLKLLWARTFSVVNRFSIFLQHILGQTLTPNSAKETVCLKFNEIENIQEIHVSLLECRYNILA